jgi:hypothetical protein
MSYTNDQLNNNLRAITHSGYKSLRRLAELEALLAVAQTLSVQIVEARSKQPADRQLNLMARILNTHTVNIRKRILYIEKINNAKYQKQRIARERLKLFDAISESGILPALVRQSQLARQTANTQSREIAAARIAASVPVIRRQIEESGLPIHGTIEEREEWAKNRPPIPGVDLQAEHERVMKELENIAQGKPEDWIKDL